MNDLPSGDSVVGQHELVVNGHVVLAVGVVQLSGREEGVHTEGTCLIRDDRNEALAQFLIRMSSLKVRTTAMVVATCCLPESLRMIFRSSMLGTDKGL